MERFTPYILAFVIFLYYSIIILYSIAYMNKAILNQALL